MAASGHLFPTPPPNKAHPNFCPFHNRTGSKNSSLGEGPRAPQLIRFSLPTVSDPPPTLSISHYGLPSDSTTLLYFPRGWEKQQLPCSPLGVADATEGHISHLKLEAWHNTHVAYYTLVWDARPVIHGVEPL
ncbi:uncharacterized protein TNIN_432361 [Trichonephila inaurata madagascariensis]|uniref:Uncharacterized protein n=1 Tax=Trichonephila inaurata madagascariensis TaxID=2747483 RepID=A0A8X7CB30_9ARAC|nr:uncharacterized protein TNIN_432361 [Trichonephila inaurata madagascariensis]